MRRTQTEHIGRFPLGATLQTRGWCEWKFIFLQWTVGAIFLKCEYPEKHIEINGLEAAIPPHPTDVLTPACDAAS